MTALDMMTIEPGNNVASASDPSPAGGVVVRRVADVLSRTEFALLSAMASQPSRWVTAHELIRLALGTHHRPETSLVRVHVHNMRKKLGPLSSIIESRRGRGYRYMHPTSVTSVGQLADCPVASCGTDYYSPLARRSTQ